MAKTHGRISTFNRGCRCKACIDVYRTTTGHKPFKKAEHGTIGMYSNHKCRCEACREANRVYRRRPYLQDRKRERRRVLRIEKRRERLAYINSLKDKPCMDCGKKFPTVCMDFDHIPGKGKTFGIAVWASEPSIPWNAITDELARCELVCSNCHRVRTKQRLTT